MRVLGGHFSQLLLDRFPQVLLGRMESRADLEAISLVIESWISSSLVRFQVDGSPIFRSQVNYQPASLSN
jgi:hypothetical protein